MPVLADEQGVLLAVMRASDAAAKLAQIDPVIVAHGWSEARSAPIAWRQINWRRGRAGTPTAP